MTHELGRNLGAVSFLFFFEGVCFWRVLYADTHHVRKGGVVFFGGEENSRVNTS